MAVFAGVTDVERVAEPVDGEERRVLLGWLAFHRNALRAKCAGLDADQLVARSAPPSPLSLLGLVRHLTEMERAYGDWALGPKADLQWVWGGYTDDGPEWDIDADASMLADSMAAWDREKRPPTSGSATHVAGRIGGRQRLQRAVEPAEARRRVRPPQRPRRPDPRADRRPHRRVGDTAGSWSRPGGQRGRR